MSIRSKGACALVLVVSLALAVSLVLANEPNSVETAELNSDAERYAKIAATVECYNQRVSSKSERKRAIKAYLKTQGLSRGDFRSMEKTYAGDAEVQARVQALSSDCASRALKMPEPKKEEPKKPEPKAEKAKEGPKTSSKKRKKRSKRKRKPRKPRSVPTSSPAPNNAPPPQPDAVVAPDGSTDWGVNPWTETAKDKLSTFAVDVDTGSYTIARRGILSGQLPKAASVRVEEFVNYFKYSYPEPTDRSLPFAVSFEGSPSPFNGDHQLVRVGVQGKKLDNSERRPANLVFLVDVSGSMGAADKLGLAQRSLRIIVSQMRPGDFISLVTYAGSTRVVLEATGFDDRAKIETAIDDLTSGGSTAMESGLALAYQQALSAKEPGSINRVIVLSDGDGNVGKTSHEEILKTIEGYVNEGITVSTVGFGKGNYQDTTMEQLANKGNGNYYYIDSLSQAKRVFQEQLGGTLQVIAKDVKIQVEFDADVVEKYRLVGYENRDIADNDFRNDKVDAGEIGAGHAVTAVYELKLKKKAQGDVAIVRLRHKKPEAKKEDAASESAFTLSRDDLTSNFDDTSSDFRTAVAAVALAEVLRKSPAAEQWSLSKAADIARDAADGSTERDELLYLIQRVKELR